MKKIVLFLVFMFLTVCIFSQTIQINQPVNSYNSQNLVDFIPVTISPGTENPSIIDNLRIFLKSNNNVQYHSYCPVHNIFLLAVDKTIYPSAQAFYNNLKSSTNINSLLLKEGNQNDILSFCETQSPETIKDLEAKKALLDK